MQFVFFPDYGETDSNTTSETNLVYVYDSSSIYSDGTHRYSNLKKNRRLHTFVNVGARGLFSEPFEEQRTDRTLQLRRLTTRSAWAHFHFRFHVMHRPRARHHWP